METVSNLEQRLKRCLPIGKNIVDFVRGDKEVRALVEIGKRGAVSIIVKPREDDMYTSWRRVKGDKFTDVLNVVVWMARNPEAMSIFDGSPYAKIEI